MAAIGAGDPAVFPGLDDVLAAARRLPVCDRAAKLHALVTRLVQAHPAGDVASAAEALADASAAALADDPWAQFAKLTRHYHSRTTLSSSAPTDTLTVASTSGPP
jgi:hypothetical protein